MALIECFECKKQISDLAPACPGCGAPVKASSENISPNASADASGVHQAADGRWAYKNMRFSSNEAANLYAQSRMQKEVAAPAAATGPSIPMWLKLFGIAILFIALFSCIGSGGGNSSSSSGAVSEFDSADALTLCQMTLKKVSRDPEKAEVPYVQNHGSGDEFYFAWGPSTKMARMRNGLGLEVAATASCMVSKSQKRITSLTLNGETLI